MGSQSSTTTLIPPELKSSLLTPAAVSALAFGKGNYLAVGTGKPWFVVTCHVTRPPDASFVIDDGSLRLYNLPETKVHRTVRGLGSDVSSIVWVHPKGTEIGNILAAAGQKVSTNRPAELIAHRTCLYT